MKKATHILLLLFVFAVSACRRDLLNPQPQTSVADNSAYSTPARVQAQLLSLYASLKSGNLYGGRYMIDGDIKADNFINELSNLVTGADAWNGNPTNSATAVVNLWQAGYLAINNCNLFLDGMDSLGTKVVGDSLKTNYKAEAKLIRALSYYCLLQYYAQPYTKDNGASKGLPLRLHGIKSAGSSLLARSPVADVYAQIIKDLNDAEAGLPSKYSSAYNNSTRAHTNTVIALKTRVFLSMGKYDSVIAAANRIVSAAAPFISSKGVSLSLQADITKVYGTSATTSENIFSLPMTSTAGDNPGGQNQLAYYFSPTAKNGGVGNGEYSLNAKGIIADPGWKSTDKRRSFILVGGGKNWLVKYTAPSPYTDYPPVIRYSEVLLSLAEARTRTTNSVDAQAVALLNAVRNRSDPATTFTAASFAAPADLLTAILQERNIEFLGEGLRNNDLVRLLMTIPGKGSAPAYGPGDRGYIWPISSTELSLNTLCTDN
ncbi:MAG: RagB/SusD family nutrient uptake outer membrane protein [Bacteroidetes bacterium]|nr:RagB/SusD family nutrient uptake outer membrane protein [Bacteroidota bacterium]